MLKLLLTLYIQLVAGNYEYERPTQQNVATSSAKVGASYAKASWYGRKACKNRIYGKTCKTASGEVFNEEAQTMACSSDFSLGDNISICYNGNCVVVRCNDRGGFEKYGRKFDLTRNTFRTLAPLSRGIIKVRWEVVK